MQRKSRSFLIALAVAALGSCRGLEAHGAKPRANGSWDPAAGLLLEGRVVTMDTSHRVFEDGRVLVRDGRITAVWNGPHRPHGVELGDAVRVKIGPDASIFPGLINLHGHPAYNTLPTWLPPASHVQASLGRPAGTEAYANRYQWNSVGVTSPFEYRRLVETPNLLLTSPIALNLAAECVKYAEARAILGGETALQGATPNAAYDDLLVRNVDNVNFGRDRIENRVPSIDSMSAAGADGLLARMRTGLVDAWLVHLAEGVRDDQRRPGDPASSRAEFATLAAKGLLNDATVVVHGTGLEPADFAAMAAAPPARLDGTTDGRGAKLVWSPLSNLLLYGTTTLVYDALQAGLTVSLGTDWAPSGSPGLLAELKVADLALRDPRLLGQTRSHAAGLAIDAANAHARREAEIALDRVLVEMVTINPARTLRWDGEVGSIEAGKLADLLVIAKPRPRRPHLPRSPYRDLIDATERDVSLVLVGGEPLAGDVGLLSTLKPGDVEIVTSVTGGFAKAIDITRAGVPNGTQSLDELMNTLEASLRALGGDHPPAEGGPADTTNTYGYLKARIPGAAGLTDAQFRAQLAAFVGTIGGRLNLEAVGLAPLFTTDDDWLLAITAGQLGSTAPYGPYDANFNHVSEQGNPLARFEPRWYRP